MALLGIDEIRTPKEFDSEKFISEYFKPMRISKERKEIREEAARDFRDFLLFILALIATESSYNALNWAYIEEQFRLEMEQRALEYARRSQELEDYIAEKASDFVSVTRDKDLSDPYWTSDERATYEAVNEANSVVGLSELQRAQERGAVEKRWRTERDNRVRFTHRMVDGESVELDGMFEVGDALMRYPGDFFHSVRESVNCRCGLEYLDEDGNVVFVGKKADKVNKTNEKVQYTSDENRGILEMAGANIGRFMTNIADGISYAVSNNRGGAIDDVEQQRRARREIQRRIDDGEYSLSLNIDDFNEHIQGSSLYRSVTKDRGQEPSRLFISFQEAQQIINEYSGKGRAFISKSGKVMDKEFVTLDYVVGEIFDDELMDWVKTRRVAIHHGKEWSHIVPVKERPEYE